MAAATSPHDGTRSERPSGRPAGVRRSGGFTLRDLSLAQATALGIAVTAVVLAALAGLAAWQTGRALAAAERAEHAATADQTRWQLQTLAAADGARLTEAAFSDALYADLGRLAERPDTAFRPAFVDRYSQRHGDQFLGVYDLQGRPLFRWTTPPAAALESAAVSNALFRVLDNREATAGLLRRGDEVLWVAGAPVLPAAPVASAPIRGYVVTVRRFRTAELSPIHGGRPMPVDLEPLAPSRQPARTVVSSVSGGDSVRIAFPVNDVFAERSLGAAVRVDRRSFQQAGRRVQWLLLATLVVIGGLAGTGWWLARRWIVGPVLRFSDALAPVREGQTPTLLQGVSTAVEWQSAVAAVNRLLTHLRTEQDRAGRLVGAVRDGVWTWSIPSDAWTFNERFRELLGHDERTLPATRAALSALIHPEEREAALEAVERCGRDAAPLILEVRLRRRDGSHGWYRLAAQTHVDHSGTPIEMVGRLVGLDEERAAHDRVEELARARREADRSQGDLLLAVARSGAGALWADDVALIGQCLAGTRALEVEPFDLHEFLQEVAAGWAPPARVAISPGVTTRVRGDRKLLGHALAPLLRVIGPTGGEVSLRAERDPELADGVRLVVESAGKSGLADRAWVAALLATGSADAGSDGPPAERALALRAAHHAIRALEATAGVDDSAGARAWVSVSLPEVVEEYAATEMPDFGDPAGRSWADELAWPPPSAAAPEPGPVAPAAPEPRVELVADATVTIDLDALSAPPPAPAAPSVVEPGFVRQLEPGEARNSLAVHMAAAFLKDAPERARALGTAAQAGDLATARSLAQNLGGMAGLVTAGALAAACEAFSRAADEIPPDPLPHLGAIDAALSAATAEFARALGSTAPAPTGGATEPAIDAATLAQLRSSIAVDPLGLGGQLVSMFVAEAPLRVEALARAAAQGDDATFRSTAVELKHMGELVGAAGLARRCEALREARPASGEVAGHRAELDRARQTLEELLQAGTHA